MQPIDWKSLSSLEAGDLQTKLLNLADDEMKGLDSEAEAQTLQTLPEPIQVIWVLSNLSLEVMMGSLLAYFMNSPGRHAPVAIWALNEIGASRMAEILSRAAKSVEIHHQAWYAQQAQLSDTEEVYDVVSPYADLPNADELVELTQEYREAEDEENWGDLLDAYLKRSVEALAIA